MSRPDRHRSRRAAQLLESFESRLLLSTNVALLPALRAAGALARIPVAHTTLALPTTIKTKGKGVTPHASTPVGNGYNPTQIRHAYGVDQVMFGNVVGDGAGQTIAIIDAYDAPNAFADLQAFDAAFGLADPPSFQKFSQTGSTTLPGPDPVRGFKSWNLESSLDVQWSHAIAPKASLILVEAVNNNLTNLFAAVTWAKAQPGVSVVSMSFGGDDSTGVTFNDSTFTTPSNHPGVTFVASTGDTAAPAGYPSTSDNVVAVGGTTLLADSFGNYSSEMGWSQGGGGISTDSGKPTYQSSVTQSSTRRTTPDLSLVADPNTGVAVYDSWDFAGSPWVQLGGTSLSAPLFAGMVAIADQGRALFGLGSLDGRSQTLPAIYNLPAADFHDITSGNNGFAAGPGYDLVTGRGTPIAPLFIPGLAGLSSISGRMYEDRNTDGIFNAGDVAVSGGTAFIDSNNNGTLDPGGNVTLASTGAAVAIPDNTSNGTTLTLGSSLAGLITHVDVTVKITHLSARDISIFLIAPDNTQLLLVNGAGGTTGHNFTNTTFDDSAATLISAGSAPFTGTYRPTTLLSPLNGKLAAGTWKLKVSDTRSGITGTVDNWSIHLVTRAETSVTAAADGSYALSLPTGSNFNLRPVSPADEAPIPTASYNFTPSGAVTGKDFSFFPTAFTAGSGQSFYLWIDPQQNKLQISTTGAASNPTYQVAPAALASLTFRLSGANSKLTADFSLGTPLPSGGIILDGANDPTSELIIIGQSSAQNFTMTDTQIGPIGGPMINYQNLSTLSLYSSTINFTGALNNLQFLNINNGTNFNWG